MKSYKDISEFYSENMRRTATIRLELTTKVYHVSVTNESGHAFSTVFENEDDAEEYAEEWVLNEQI